MAWADLPTAGYGWATVALDRALQPVASGTTAPLKKLICRLFQEKE
jgi:hypothetical protein